MVADSVLKADSITTGIIVDEPKEVVFVYDKGKAVTTIVTTGIQDNDFIEVISGLQDGTEVVTAPYNIITKKLKNGASLKKVTRDKLIE
jgi:HlyD family secretion protein